MFNIIPARSNDASSIETLLDRAFGPDRNHKKSYHYRINVNDVPQLRFVAVADGRLCGTIRFWPVIIGQETPALLLGPLGVDPDHQSMGIGADLMLHGMHVARDQGHGIVLLVGELEYYGRFGFGPASPRGIVMPGEQDHRLLVRELSNDALEGVSGEIRSLSLQSESAA